MTYKVEKKLVKLKDIILRLNSHKAKYVYRQRLNYLGLNYIILLLWSYTESLYLFTYLRIFHALFDVFLPVGREWV